MIPSKKITARNFKVGVSIWTFFGVYFAADLVFVSIFGESVWTHNVIPIIIALLMEWLVMFTFDYVMALQHIVANEIFPSYNSRSKTLKLYFSEKDDIKTIITMVFNKDFTDDEYKKAHKILVKSVNDGASQQKALNDFVDSVKDKLHIGVMEEKGLPAKMMVFNDGA